MDGDEGKGSIMLSDLRVHCTIPVADLDRARAFYAEKLGMEPAEVTPSGATYRCGEGTAFLLFPTPSSGTAENTAMGFTTLDIEEEVTELRDRGVVFEEYDHPTLKTVDGIAQVPVGRAAWFKDSEGNIIGLVQFD